MVVVPEQGKEFNCSPKQTEYIWEGKIQNSSKEAIPYISKKANWVKREASELDIPTIHELCKPEHGYTIDDLAGDFLDNGGDGWSKAALLLALKEHGALFQQKKSEFFARTPKEIEKIKEQESKQEEKRKLQIKEQQWADFLSDGYYPNIAEEEKEHWERFLQRLVNFVVHLGFSHEKEYFCTLFRCSLKDPVVTERLIINCLNKARFPISWGRALLERSSAEIEFKDEEIASSEELVTKNIWETPFEWDTRDHRNKNVFTVDNPETKDFDDAVGWEETENGTILRIYIADVASYTSANSILFGCAAKRISSLYTIKDVLPMLPPILSENVLSLIERQDRAAMTFEIPIDQDGERFSIYRSIINVERNLSYREVDRFIEYGEGKWRKLWSFCLALKDRRIKNGCLEIDRREVKLDISDPERITISAVRENTPATAMIEELAIYTNYLAAEYCQKHEIPALFRNQPPYGIDKGLDENAKLRLKDIRIQPAYIDLQPEGHSALGLECYLQVTSPIRRFSDLVNQTILILAATNGEIGFSNNELNLWAKNIEEIQREYVQLEKTLLDHWKIKYLAQNRDKPYRAQFIRYLKNRGALLNILEVQLYAEAQIDGLQEDEEISVLIESIKPEYNRITLRRDY